MNKPTKALNDIEIIEARNREIKQLTKELASMTNQRDILARNAAAKSKKDYARNEEIKRLKGELAKLRLKYALQESSVAEAMRDLIELEAENDRLNGELAEAREAIIDLLDVQNGSPLIKYEKEWQKAVDRCRAAVRAAGKEESVWHRPE